MIAGFETQTKLLTDYERTVLLPRILEGFKRIAESGHSITSKLIIKKATREGMQISGPRLRKIINHIRINGLVQIIVADGNTGYRVVNTKDKAEKYLHSLDQRINNIQHMRDEVAKQAKKLNIIQ